MTRPRVAVITGEPLWPVVHGGRERTAELTRVIASVADVTVIYPRQEGASEVAEASPAGIFLQTVPGAQRRSSSPLHFTTWRPRMGEYVFNRRSRLALRDVLSQVSPDLVIFAHSYLACSSGVMDKSYRCVVDFANIEVDRYRGFVTAGRGYHKVTAVIEELKARQWEPRVARNADIAIALTDRDAARLRGWRAHVSLVPNGIVRRDYVPSPPSGPVVFVGSATYAPNERAGRWLASHVWPLVRGRIGDAQLQLVGRGASAAWADLEDPARGVSIFSDVPNVAPFFESASVVAAPVAYGGGAQLKLANAFSHSRVVVATPYSLNSLPRAARELCASASTELEMSEAISRLLAKPEDRWLLERELSGLVDGGMTWESVAAPILRLLD